MYNIKHNNLNEPMKNMFEISNKEFHILRNNDVKVVMTRNFRC